MNSPHDSPVLPPDSPDPRYPRLNLHNGEGKPSTLHLAPGVKIQLTATQTTVLLLLKHEWDAGRRHDGIDRGWIGTDRLHANYMDKTRRRLQKGSVSTYANRVIFRIAELVNAHPAIVPLIERSLGRGFRFTRDLPVIESDGKEREAGADS